MRGLHSKWFFVAVIATGLVGLWGLAAAIAKKAPGRWFKVATWVAIGAMLVQVGLGFALYGQGIRPDDDFHLFYGFVILFTFTFAYIYRSQLAKRPALAYGLLLLFVMGLGLRAWANV
ncbi:MAG: hypothetical protein WD184_10415 [Acidimicrobiia bacterium]